MLTLAVVILSTAAINTLIADFDESNPAVAAFTARENAVVKIVCGDRELVLYKLSRDLFSVVPCSRQLALIFPIEAGTYLFSPG